jgi:hypothetical protein
MITSASPIGAIHKMRPGDLGYRYDLHPGSFHGGEGGGGGDGSVEAVERQRERYLRAVKRYDNQVIAAMHDQSEALVGGLGSGVTALSNGVLPIASSTGLQVGLVWGRSIVTGADSVLTSANFTQISTPQIGSALAKTALGAAGLLGPAGSGAQTATAPPVTVAATPTTTPVPVVTNHIYIDGTEIKSFTTQQINTTLGKLADSIAAQRG